MGGIAPFGYKHAQDGKVEINKYEQDMIKGILKMREQGISMIKIARHYADKGALNRAGNPVDRHQIRRMIEYAKRPKT